MFGLKRCVGSTSATTYAVVGTMNKVPIALLGTFLFETKMTAQVIRNPFLVLILSFRFFLNVDFKILSLLFSLSHLIAFVSSHLLFFRRGTRLWL